MSQGAEHDLNRLFSAAEVRARTRDVLAAVDAGAGQAFRLNRRALPEVADYVATTTRAAYPTLDVPPHSRWRHFERADGGSDWADLDASQDWTDERGRSMARIDLAFVSVLLDAGAGADWRYRTADGRELARSEGLAAASLEMFSAGAFSSDPTDPLRVDARGLAALSTGDLAIGMQSTGEGGAVVGLEGRRALLANLATALEGAPDAFGAGPPRPGGLFDWVAANQADAPALLTLLLQRLGPIWPQGRRIGDMSLGDVWTSPAVSRDDATDGLLPLHKLSQWLVYSLTEPFADAGAPLADIGGLTGLGEYRNGGLFVDFGVLIPLDRKAFDEIHEPGDPLVVEWRAATVALLDVLLPLTRDALDAPDFNLAQLLQGGTWAAGRRIAGEKRAGGPPPLVVASDGTLF